MKSKSIIWITAITLIGLFTLTLYSCSDDSESNSAKENHFAYDGEIFNLSHGFTYMTELTSGYFDFETSLLSEDIIYDEQDEVFSGTGHIIFFGFMNSENNLTEGTYHYNPNGQVAPFTFDQAWFYTNITIGVDDPGESRSYITCGSVDVERSGSKYELTIDAVTESGKPLTGYYKGFLHENFN